VDAALIYVLGNVPSANVRSNLSDFAQAFMLRLNEPVASRLQMFPDAPHREDEFIHFINDYLPMALLVSFMLVVAGICKDLVLEKEKKLKVPSTTTLCTMSKPYKTVKRYSSSEQVISELSGVASFFGVGCRVTT